MVGIVVVVHLVCIMTVNNYDSNAEEQNCEKKQFCFSKMDFIYSRSM